MAIREVLSDNRTTVQPFPASLAVAVGDLCFWDSVALVAKPASSRADKGSLVLNQRDFQGIFLGVSLDQRLPTETSTGNDSRRALALDGIFDCDCTSTTWEIGDLVAIDRNASTSINYNQQVAKVSNPGLAIGNVIKREPTATTKVRARLTSSLLFADWTSALLIGGQGRGATVLSDASQSITAATNPFISMVPTAARNVTLPDEATSVGLVFYFTNNSAGAFTVTFLASNAGAVKGNGACPQNKTALLWCDGTNWNGLISA